MLVKIKAYHFEVSFFEWIAHTKLRKSKKKTVQCALVLHSLTQNAPLLPINHRQGPYSIASFAIVYWPQFIDLRLPQQVASNLKKEEKKSILSH